MTILRKSSYDNYAAWKNAQADLADCTPGKDPRNDYLNSIRGRTGRFLYEYSDAVIALPLLLGLALLSWFFVSMTAWIGLLGEPESVVNLFPRLIREPLYPLAAILVEAALSAWGWMEAFRYERSKYLPDRKAELKNEEKSARSNLMRNLRTDLDRAGFTVLSEDAKNIAFVLTEGVAVLVDNPEGQPMFLINGAPVMEGYGNLSTEYDYQVTSMNGSAIRAGKPMMLNRTKKNAPWFGRSNKV